MKCLKCVKGWAHRGSWYGITWTMSLRRSCLHWVSYGVGVLMGSDMHPEHALGLLLAILGNTFLGQVHLRQTYRQNLHDGQGATLFPCAAHAAFLYKDNLHCKA